MQVSGRTVLITGATGGLGNAIARRLHAEGAQLILTGRRVQALAPLADELGASAMAADMGDADDVERLAAQAAEAEILVANAALPASGWFTALTPHEIDVMLDVNLRAPIQLARALAPAMVARGGGHIVFISSLSGLAASPASSMYNATKFGLRGFALGLRQDLAGAGVGVSVVLPGFIRDAGMFADSGARLPPGVGTKSPEDVAAATIEAIQRDRAEVLVAPLGLRFGALVASVAPGFASRAQRLAGGHRVAANIAAGQTGKRPH